VDCDPPPQDPIPSPAKDWKFGGAGPIEIWKSERFYTSLTTIGSEKLCVNDGLKYVPRNIGDKPIRALALVLVVGDEKRLFVSMISKGQVDPGQDFGGYLMNRTVVPIFEPDFVLFADGTSWGPDTYGRSALFANYYRGRELALRRAAELIGDNSNDFHYRIVSGPYARSWSVKLPYPATMRGVSS
jgi:hypothetical protein